MLILCLGSNYFQKSLHDLGHKVMILEKQSGLSVKELIHQIGDRPDLIIYTDSLGQKTWPYDWLDVDIPTAYYAVDSPLNYWWQKYYSQVFDVCFVDQKKFASKMSLDLNSQAHWLPVGIETEFYKASDADLKNTKQIYDFAFVGVLNENVRPKRSRLVELISGKYNLKTLGDRQKGWVGVSEAADFYRQAKLVLNENLFDGLTTRMLEAMASGSVLFTEKAGGDLANFFVPGEDFAWFEPWEVLEVAKFWLNNDEMRKKVAKQGQEKVLSAHDVINRAEFLLKTMADFKAGNIQKKLNYGEACLAEGTTLLLTAFRWPNEDGKQRFEQAQQLLLKARQEGQNSAELFFMLGQIARLKGELSAAKLNLSRSWEAGSYRAGLALAFTALAQGDYQSAEKSLAQISGLKEDFPKLKSKDSNSIFSAEAALAMAEFLEEKGEALSPGFSRNQHDPAIWMALEFYQHAIFVKPDYLKALKGLAKLLLEAKAPAEASLVLENAKKVSAGDSEVQYLLNKAAESSYLNINLH